MGGERTARLAVAGRRSRSARHASPRIWRGATPARQPTKAFRVMPSTSVPAVAAALRTAVGSAVHGTLQFCDLRTA